MSDSLFFSLVWLWIGIGLVIFPVLLFVTAPYGRHSTSTWGPVMNSTAGWILMEFPSLLIFSLFFLLGKGEHSFVMWVFFSLWVIHYVNRTFIFPFRFKTKEKKMPLSIVSMGLFFNLINGSINGYFLGSVAGIYPDSWMLGWQFISGLILFATGFYINQKADFMLINLRAPGETGYKIPRGWLFRYISCPNHFGEIIEWTGFAVMVWSLPAFAFAWWTAVNLIPRAFSHHKWYRKKFDDYPKERKSVIPFLF